jgi:diapolycopene oxygenase
VDVFEKNAHVGGKLNLLERDGFKFDLGPSILTMPQLFRSVFEKAGKRLEDYMELELISPQWRNFFEDGTTIDLYAKPADTVANNDGLGPDDERDMTTFLEYSRALYEASEPSYFDRGLDTFWQMIRYHGVFASLFSFDIFKTMHQGVSRRIRNEYLVKIYDFFVTYIGSSAFDAPAVLNMLPHIQAEFGLLYVKGGLYKLALGLRKLLEDIGVTIHLESEVVEIRRDGRRATGVRLKDGSAHDADVVVSNMEVIPAHRTLLGASDRDVARFDKFAPACSGLVIHLGTDIEYPQLAHHNFFFSGNPEKHFADVYRKKKLPEDPTIYLVAAARSDRSQAPDGCENIKILPHIPHIQDPPFTAADYDALKGRVLDKLERMGLKDLRKHAIVDHMWVPDDIQRLYYSNRGAIYGVEANKKLNFGFKAPKRSELFENLWFVGGSVNPGGGMPTSLLSGVQVARKLTKAEG